MVGLEIEVAACVVSGLGIGVGAGVNSEEASVGPGVPLKPLSEFGIEVDA